MQIESLLTASRTVCGVEVNSKKGALEILANIITQDIPAIDADDLLRRFIARERLGSTGIGHGIAIPHCRVNTCSTAVGALITLANPIPYDAVDGEYVDILFAMLVPDEAHDEHLKNLAALAGALGNGVFRQHLRAARDNQALYHAALGN